jgi:hypothetical protein
LQKGSQSVAKAAAREMAQKVRMEPPSSET